MTKPDNTEDELFEFVGEQVVIAHEKNTNLDRYQRLAGRESQVILSTEKIVEYIQATYLHKNTVRAAIGEDEQVMWYGKMDNIALKRNEMRSELRQRLNLEERT